MSQDKRVQGLPGILAETLLLKRKKEKRKKERKEEKKKETENTKTKPTSKLVFSGIKRHRSLQLPLSSINISGSSVVFAVVGIEPLALGELGKELYHSAAPQPKSFLNLKELWAVSPLQSEDKASASSIVFLPDLEPYIDLGRGPVVLRGWAGEATRLHSTGETDQLCPVRKEIFGTVEAGEGFF